MGCVVVFMLVYPPLGYPLCVFLQLYNKALKPAVIWMLTISNTFLFIVLPSTCSSTHAGLSPATNPNDLSAMCSRVRSNLLYLTADNND